MTAQNADDLYLETIHHPSRLVYIQVRDTRYQLYTLSAVCVCVCVELLSDNGGKQPRHQEKKEKKKKTNGNQIENNL